MRTILKGEKHVWVRLTLKEYDIIRFLEKHEYTFLSEKGMGKQ